MGPFAAGLVLESLLVPLVLAGLVTVAARWVDHHPWLKLAPAVAIFLAVGATYGLALGWPSISAPSARDKILFSALIGLLAGLVVGKRPRWSSSVLIAGAIAIPIWVGLPALQQGRWDSGLLLLPIAVALISLWLAKGPFASAGLPVRFLPLALAVGLAGIAAFAKALTFAELSLSLGAALIAVLLISREPLTMPAGLAAAAMLLALCAALLVYGDASPAAILVLGATVAAKPLARLLNGASGAAATRRRVLLFLVAPVVIAIVIARIDGGTISIY